MAFPFLSGVIYALYIAAIHFKQLPATVRRRPLISVHLLFWLLLVFLWLFLERGGLALAVLLKIALSFPYLIWCTGYKLLSGQRGQAQVLPSAPLHHFRGVTGFWTFFAIVNFWYVIGNVAVAKRASLFFSLFDL